MKLTAILLTVLCMHVSARSYEQTVSFNGKDVPLRNVLHAIENQTGLSFFYSYSVLNDSKKVTISLKNVSVDELLKEVLKDQDVNYYQEGKTIFIVRTLVRDKNRSFADSVPGSIDVSGIVVNVKKEPLPGASVLVRHRKLATQTNDKGRFLLKGLSPQDILQITYTGYEEKWVTVADGGDMVIEMVTSNNRLDEAQVIAYGNTTQRMATGDITTVKGEDIARQPINNVLPGLEGRVPGLFVTQANGLPGGGVTVIVQGKNSISNGNDPLYVIDGVPYTSQLVSTLGNTILGRSGASSNGQEAGAGNPMSYLDPSNIESVTILKDADATAIYGSRAANGAILITTKKGRPGATRVDLNANQGVGQVGHYMPFMNAQQYFEMRHEALGNDGVAAPKSSDYDINGFWDTTRYTNWQKKLIGNNAQYTNINGSVSGGTEYTQYLINSTFHRETTVFPNDFSDKRGSVLVNVNSISTNRKFHIQVSANYMIDDNHLPTNDLTNAITIAPDAPSLYNPDGTLNWMPTSTGATTFTNPVAALFRTYTNKANNLISNAVLSYNLLSGLNIRSSFGYTNLQTNEITTSPWSSIQPDAHANNPRSANYSNSAISSWIIEPQLEFKKTLSQHKLDILAGTTFEQNTSTLQQFFGSGYNSDAVLQNIGSAATITGSNTLYAYKYDALFGRLNYSWGDKYILDLSARRDGSSRFGPDNSLHNFGAAGVAWIFSQEGLFQHRLSWFSFGKVRASYGTTGNDQIGDYKFLSLYNPVTAAVPYQGSPGLLPSGLSNPRLQWEETRKLEVAFDLGFIKDRILLNATYFENRSSNEILSYLLPINTGFNFVAQNLPATVENFGLELTLNTINIKTRNFTWSSSFNFTIPRNKLVHFPGLSKSSYSNAFVIGKPITIIKAYRYAGVNSTTGEYQFYNSKGNLTYTPAVNVDQTAIINIDSRSYGGFSNRLYYKGIAVDFLLQYVNRNAPNNYTGYINPGAFGLNQPTYMLNRWQNPGDNAAHQRYNENYSIFSQLSLVNASTAAYSDASFLRLKNASISWTIPSSWARHMHLNMGAIYLQGENIVTFTRYKGGLDPESLAFTILPPLRMVTAGIKIGL